MNELESRAKHLKSIDDLIKTISTHKDKITAMTIVLEIKTDNGETCFFNCVGTTATALGLLDMGHDYYLHSCHDSDLTLDDIK